MNNTLSNGKGLKEAVIQEIEGMTPATVANNICTISSDMLYNLAYEGDVEALAALEGVAALVPERSAVRKRLTIAYNRFISGLDRLYEGAHKGNTDDLEALKRLALATENAAVSINLVKAS